MPVSKEMDFVGLAPVRYCGSSIGTLLCSSLAATLAFAFAFALAFAFAFAFAFAVAFTFAFRASVLGVAVLVADVALSSCIRVCNRACARLIPRRTACVACSASATPQLAFSTKNFFRLGRVPSVRFQAHRQPTIVRCSTKGSLGSSSTRYNRRVCLLRVLFVGNAAA